MVSSQDQKTYDLELRVEDSYGNLVLGSIGEHTVSVLDSQFTGLQFTPNTQAKLKPTGTLSVNHIVAETVELPIAFYRAPFGVDGTLVDKSDTIRLVFLPGELDDEVQSRRSYQSKTYA